MAKPLVSDELWTIIEPHIPIKLRKKCNAGHKPLHPRTCLTDILFVLRTGIQWEMRHKKWGGVA